jgi:hypothetical protein
MNEISNTDSSGVEGESEQGDDFSDSARAQLEAYRSDCQQLTLKLGQLVESSDEWSETSTQLNKLRGEITLLETKLVCDGAFDDPIAQSGTRSEPESIRTDDAPISIYEVAASLDDDMKIKSKMKTEQSNDGLERFVSDSMSRPREESKLTDDPESNQHQVPSEEDEEDGVSVGRTSFRSTITTKPPSLIDIDYQDCDFDTNNVHSISAIFDPRLSSVSSIPILRATLVTEEETKDDGPLEPVYDAVEVSDEPQPFFKRQRALSLVIIICILAAVVIGVIFAFRHEKSEPENSNAMILPASSSAPSVYAPSTQPSITNQPTFCDTYHSVSQGTVYKKDCQSYCDPVVGIDGNTTIIGRLYDGIVQFYNSFDNGTFQQTATFNLDTFIYSVAISGNVAVVGAPEINILPVLPMCLKEIHWGYGVKPCS